MNKMSHLLLIVMTISEFCCQLRKMKKTSKNEALKNCDKRQFDRCRFALIHTKSKGTSKST